MHRLPILLVLAATGAPAGERDAAELVQATAGELATRFAECRKAVPPMAFIARFWMNDNGPVVTAASEVLVEEDVEDWLERADAVADRVPLPKMTCQALAFGVAERELDIGHLLPGEYALLAPRFPVDEGSRIAQRDRDLAIGCMKRMYNTGLRDYEAVDRYCACQTRAIKARWNDREIDDWLAKVEDGTASYDQSFVDAVANGVDACVR